MSKDIMIIIGFIITISILCKLWNYFMMKQYEKSKISAKDEKKMIYGTYIDRLEKLVLAGDCADRNTDYEFIEAAKRIAIPDNVRIKLYDKE